MGDLIPSPSHPSHSCMTVESWAFTYIQENRHLGGHVSPSTSPPQTKRFFVPKRTKKYASTSQVSATAEVVLTVHQPCISICIGNSAATTASSIGKHTCTRLYYDWLLFSLRLQSGSSPSKSHPLTMAVNHPLSQRGILV